MDLLLLLVFTTLFLLLLSIIKALKSRLFLSSKNLPPGNLGWPIIGETPAFFQAFKQGKPEIFVTERKEKYKSNVFKTSFLGEPYIILCGTAGNKLLFSNENKLVNSWWPGSARKLFSSSLLNTVGDDAKRIRKMLLSFLSPDALKGYVERIDLITRQHINTYWQGKQEMKVHPMLGLYTFEVACHLFASIDDHEYILKLVALFRVFKEGTLAFPISIPGTKFYSSKKAGNAIREEIKFIIKKRKQELEKKMVSPTKDLLTHLLANPDSDGKFLTEAEIIDNFLLLLFAGYDTSRSTSTVLIKYLGQMPHVYQKVLQEHMDIVKSKEAGELLKWEDVQKMKYSSNVISEVMRLLPPGPGIFRQAIVDFTYEGYTIPKGWKLYTFNVSTQMDPEIFENPEKFDPSRFENKVPVQYSYFPFGGGPRMCLGNEFARVQMLIFLHHIVRRFQWEASMPDEGFTYESILAPCHGFQVHLRPHLNQF